MHYNSSEEAAREVAESVESLGGSAHLLQADVSTQAGCDELVSQVQAAADSLDALVNNAGGMVQRHAIDDGLEWDLIDRIFTLNTHSTIYLTTRLLPLLRAGSDPCVVNMTSIAQRHGAPTATIYGAAKSAIDSFTRGTAKELAPDIRVNAVAPGVIETPFHDRYSTPEQMRTFAERTPLKRNGNADHIARAVAFVLDNDFVTGETIDVNGGMFMR